jgi:NADH:ubiquinone oxidoreductase subunit 2 (subunit N)
LTGSQLDHMGLLSVLVILMMGFVVEVIFRIIGNFSDEMRRWFWYVYVGGSFLFIALLLFSKDDMALMFRKFSVDAIGNIKFETVVFFIMVLLLALMATLIITRKETQNNLKNNQESGWS